MSEAAIAALIGAIVGGAISAASAWLLQVRAESSRLNQLKKLLLTGLLDDLDNAPELLQKLAEDYTKTGLVSYATAGEIIGSRDIYWKNKDWYCHVNRRLATLKRWNLENRCITAIGFRKTSSATRCGCTTVSA